LELHGRWGCFAFNPQPFAERGHSDAVADGEIPLSHLTFMETCYQPLPLLSSLAAADQTSF
jgi:hypothetical protein